jgi:hypothetical protein
MNVSRPAPPVSPLPVTGVRDLRPPAPREPASPAAAAPPAEATLWDLLTPEEREFFAQQSALGPITYRPGGRTAGTPPAPTGQRIDVRG